MSGSLALAMSWAARFEVTLVVPRKHRAERPRSAQVAATYVPRPRLCRHALTNACTAAATVTTPRVRCMKMGPIPRLPPLERMSVGTSHTCPVRRSRNTYRAITPIRQQPQITHGCECACDRRVEVFCVLRDSVIIRRCVEFVRQEPASCHMCRRAWERPPYSFRRGSVTPPYKKRSSRQRPTLPQGCPCSTIGAGGLSFSVRNGKRRFPSAMATGSKTDAGRRQVARSERPPPRPSGLGAPAKR
jgi:hypothetical protein